MLSGQEFVSFIFKISYKFASKQKYMSLSKIFVNNTQIVGVDDDPTAGSDNLVKSGGVYNSTPTVANSSTESDLDISDEHGNVIMRLKDGHIQTQKFNSLTSAGGGKITYSIIKNL